MRLSHRTLLSLMKRIGGKVDDYAQYRPSALSMQNLIDFGKTFKGCVIRLTSSIADYRFIELSMVSRFLGRKAEEKASFNFLRKELLVRLANVMKEVALLPQSLLGTPSATLVYQWYQESFQDLLQFENVEYNPNISNDFTAQLTQIVNRHNTVVETMAEGLMEMKASHGIDPVTQKNIQFFLNRFYLSRISIRMLISQHRNHFISIVVDDNMSLLSVILFGQATHPFYQSSQHIGCIDPNCDVLGVIQDAYENARFLCDRYYLRSPGMKLESKNDLQPSQPITIVYVPSHLYHIMHELLKNALRAVTEYQQDKDSLPDVNVQVVKGKEDLSIRISDNGGGVPCRLVGNLFNYLYTTASLPSPELHEPSAPMAGLGYGLPVSRLYARYFHGDLFLVSMEGYGSDAYVYLKALAVEASEVIPAYSAMSKKMFNTVEKGSQWSRAVPTNNLFVTSCTLHAYDGSTD
ncbi:Probable [pyruvate dehydrogenase [lipoamide]] kin ase, mitochondrial [Trichuris trichiura]|uniref:Protein-serine/threonine kinase n=1 Tax=Trichuris trichiura TaxID=36087 RepID=A0A077Z8B1_TRITR|nr:Probable [pyruvate dehydrogenase [lipoamide]] kin ase, mitochondrial [Trichuris trichiura]